MNNILNGIQERIVAFIRSKFDRWRKNSAFGIRRRRIRQVFQLPLNVIEILTDFCWLFRLFYGKGELCLCKPHPAVAG
jgi:hypothetical protein